MRTQLQTFSGDDPIWRFVTQLAAERFTGAAHVGADPRLRLFAVDGRVYFAERDGDAPVGTRLVNFGVLTATQLERGQVHIGDVVSLARLFHRDPSIDRDAVELTIEMATERLLESMATRPVVDVELYPLRHHPAGLHLWARAVPAAVYEPPAPAANDEVVEEAVDEVVAAPVPAAAPWTPELPSDAVPVEAAPVEETAAEAVPVEQPAAEDVRVDAVAAPPEAVSEAVPEPHTEYRLAPMSLASTLVPEPQPEPVAEAAVHVDEPMTPSPVALPEPEPVQTLSLSSLATLAPVEPEPVPTHGWANDEASAPEPPAEEVPVLTGLQALQALQALDAGPDTAPAADLDTYPGVDREPEAAAATPTPAATHLLGSLLASGHHQADEPDPLNALDALARLDPLDDVADAGTAPTAVAPYELHSFEPNIDPSIAPSLPTLAAAPTSVAEIKAHQASAADAGSGWGATHNMAAVEIWEMVDDMLAEPKPEENLVSAGGGDRKGRGWLRGRKG